MNLGKADTINFADSPSVDGLAVPLAPKEDINGFGVVKVSISSLLSLLL